MTIVYFRLCSMTPQDSVDDMGEGTHFGSLRKSSNYCESRKKWGSKLSMLKKKL